MLDILVALFRDLKKLYLLDVLIAFFKKKNKINPQHKGGNNKFLVGILVLGSHSPKTNT
jgi:hypothetical protein